MRLLTDDVVNVLGDNVDAVVRTNAVRALMTASPIFADVRRGLGSCCCAAFPPVD